jgi:tRNA(Ile)-lysidine synthase
MVEGTQQPEEPEPSWLEAQVRAGALLRPGRPVVVMLSGGRDSTCLLDLAVRIAGAGAVSALHVNYALREAADDDQRHCEALCAALAVPLELRRPDAPLTGNLQAWARAQRYGAAAQLALARGADVAAGHTATDQVETILYRLASSPSRRALLGMRPRDGALVRPLLPFTREQTAAYCRARGLRWREDETNDSPVYARGRVRGRLVPLLEEIHPAAQENVLALAELLRDEAEVLDAAVDGALGGAREIELEALRTLPAALARLVVQRLADAAVGRPAPGVARRLPEIVGLRADGAIDLPHGVRAVARNGVLRFERTPALSRRQTKPTGREAPP